MVWVHGRTKNPALVVTASLRLLLKRGGNDWVDRIPRGEKDVTVASGATTARLWQDYRSDLVRTVFGKHCCHSLDPQAVIGGVGGCACHHDCVCDRDA